MECDLQNNHTLSKQRLLVTALGDLLFLTHGVVLPRIDLVAEVLRAPYEIARQNLESADG